MTNTNPPTIDELKALRDLPTLTVNEASRILRLGRNATYAAIARGEIPSLKVGGRVLVITARLFALLENGSES